jgi:hypothetical protein
MLTLLPIVIFTTDDMIYDELRDEKLVTIHPLGMQAQ